MLCVPNAAINTSKNANFSSTKLVSELMFRNTSDQWTKCMHGRLGSGSGMRTVCNKKLRYCWETVRRESMPRIAEMDVEMIT